MMSPRKNAKKNILFLGDSLTEQARGMNGFISLINRELENRNLAKKINTIGAGISGNRIYDLLFRLNKDVLSKSPNLTIILIGINDVWCKQKNGTGVDIERFEKYYREIIVQILSAESKIILCTLPLIGEKIDGQNLQDEELNSYSAIVEKLCMEYALVCCHLRQAFNSHIKQYNYENIDKGILTTDGVHLNDEGNKLVAINLWQHIEKYINTKS
jgi:lysophospholipase L1-like esterase